MDVDAELAYSKLNRQVVLLCRDGSRKARRLGLVACARYRRALEAAAIGPAPLLWTRFMRSVWTLVRELDRCPPQLSEASRAARGDLNRLVFENVDLVERWWP